MGGTPMNFACSGERKVSGLLDFWDPHTVTLTGRTRPNPSRRRGPRVSDTEREYRCDTCGHVGWSRHIDLEDLERKARP